ncbi:MAG TPA: DUF4340 domain-containing protein [Acetivibrio sp.]|nr:DUF4340 domain-containing protein [Clostridium sp.]HOQ37977.1 DUF4340 domain-containing protein [Acetivibrio sp.]HPT91715.1 DUF4340 domain-containing protein [Acetivibrio sp.]HQA56363.1 DUF4340 domain-containing protein [Acetivibrio sp.]
MKLYRNIIILVVILAALIGAYYIAKPLVGTEKEDNRNIQVIKMDKEKVVEITVENSEGKFVFKKENDQWAMVSGGDFVIDTYRIESIASNVCDLSAYKIVDDNPQDLAMFGLDKPVVISAKTSEGEMVEIEVGNITATKQAYYVKKKGENTVYTIAAYAGEILRSRKTDLRNRYILDVLTSDVTELALTKNGKLTFDAVKNSDSGWIIKEPIESGADMIRLNNALTALVRAEVTDFIEENATDLSKYGLDNPSYILKAAAGNKKVTVLLGNVKENYKETYGMFEGTNEVFTINPNSLGFLDITTVEIIDGFLFTPYIFDVTDIEVKMDGETINLKIEKIEKTSSEGQDDSNGEEEAVENFYVNGRNVSEKGEDGKSKFKKYYQALIGITADEIDPNAVVEGDAEISITYKLKKEPGTVKVEFIPRDSDSYYAMKDGQYTGLIVLKSSFNKEEGPRKSYEKLMDLLNEGD